MSLKLVCDDRERAVIPFFEESYIKNDYGVSVEVKRLQIGDFAMMYNGKIIANFERKSWVDLSASIKDNRMDNVNKMLSLREQTNCKLLYIIEGKCRNSPTKKFARIPYKALLAKLDHLIMRDDIHIIYSKDPADTAVRLIEFCTNYLSLLQKMGAGVKNEIVEGEETQNEEPEKQKDMDILCTAIPTSDLQIVYKMWSSIPNITNTTATLFIDAGYHISDLFLGKISEQTIYTMKYPSGTIIGARAKKILKVLDDNSNYKHKCNIISSIPGVTVKTAAVILVTISFVELLQGKYTVDHIAEIKKTEKTKIGKSAAEKINKFMIKNEKKE